MSNNGIDSNQKQFIEDLKKTLIDQSIKLLVETHTKQINDLGKTLMLGLFAEIGYMITHKFLLWYLLLPALSFGIYAIGIYYVSSPTIQEFNTKIVTMESSNDLVAFKKYARDYLPKINQIIKNFNELYALTIPVIGLFCCTNYLYRGNNIIWFNFMAIIMIDIIIYLQHYKNSKNKFILIIIVDIIIISLVSLSLVNVIYSWYSIFFILFLLLAVYNGYNYWRINSNKDINQSPVDDAP
jgi:hypothetical protein